MAEICFEGKAQVWLRFEECTTNFKTWNQLKEQILRRFLGPRDGALLYRLFTVKQHSTVAKYQVQFELLATSMGTLDELTLTAIFINGLHEHI